jgi:hypothetical protein
MATMQIAPVMDTKGTGSGAGNPASRRSRTLRSLIITRGACWRIAVLAAVILALTFWGWTTMIRMPGRSFRGELPPLTEDQLELRDALRRDVEHLATTIGERNVFRYARLVQAADFITSSFEAAGYATQRNEYLVDGKACSNIAVELPGITTADEIVVIGAHYDSVVGCPAANDNATGVAGVLALARACAATSMPRTIRFVAFVNEEPPFSMTDDMGSFVYARQCRANNDNIVAMISLETIGYYTDKPGTQAYPSPLLKLLYPSVGNFAAFVGNTKCAGLIRESLASFRAGCRFPSEGAAIPEFVPGVNWSDHWSFCQVGYRAIMVTDTAPYRYPHYHAAEDTPDKINWDSFARVVDGLERVVLELAGKKPGK